MLSGRLVYPTTNEHVAGVIDHELIYDPNDMGLRVREDFTPKKQTAAKQLHAIFDPAGTAPDQSDDVARFVSRFSAYRGSGVCSAMVSKWIQKTLRDNVSIEAAWLTKPETEDLEKRQSKYYTRTIKRTIRGKLPDGTIPNLPGTGGASSDPTQAMASALGDLFKLDRMQAAELGAQEKMFRDLNLVVRSRLADTAYPEGAPQVRKFFLDTVSADSIKEARAAIKQAAFHFAINIKTPRGGHAIGAAFKGDWYIFDPNEGMFAYPDDTPFIADLKKLFDHYKTFNLRVFNLSGMANQRPGWFTMPART